MQYPSSQQVSPPTGPVAAVSHPAPYQYYRELAARGPIRFDDDLGLWIVTGYRAITEALRDPAAHTRPQDELIPADLMGTATGAIYGRLVRMTDDPCSRRVKSALEGSLSAVRPARVRLIADRIARQVFDAGSRSGQADWPTTALFRLPILVMGTLLGLPEATLGDLSGQVRDFAAAIAPAPFAGSVDPGDRAARHLVDLVGTLVDGSSDPGPGGGLLGEFVRTTQSLGSDRRDLIIANVIGLLFQSLDATAGLMGNTLCALSQRLELRRVIGADPSRLSAVLTETLRHDPPVQNTRRFVVSPTVIAGQPLATGDRLLLVLAAGNRDPVVFSEPDRFDLDRTEAAPLTFGLGPHRCPGQSLARAITLAGVQEGMRHGLGNLPGTAPLTFCPSANARIPLLLAP